MAGQGAHSTVLQQEGLRVKGLRGRDDLSPRRCTRKEVMVPEVVAVPKVMVHFGQERMVGELRGRAARLVPELALPEQKNLGGEQKP